MSLAPLHALRHILQDERPLRALTVAHAMDLPRGDRERALRNDGLALYSAPMPVWRCEWPGVVFGSSESAELRTNTITTAAGRLTEATRPLVSREISCELPYDASLMRREEQVEPWLKTTADIAPLIAWIDAETHLPDHIVYEHARYDYGADALLVVRGPVSPTAAAYALCAAHTETWRALCQQPAELEALLAALARREARKLAVMAGCQADLVLVGGNAALPPAAGALAHRYDLPLWQATLAQLAADDLACGLELAALPNAFLAGLLNAQPPAALVTDWPFSAPPPEGLPLWVRLPGQALAAGPALASETAHEIMRAAAGRGLIVDLNDAGLAHCVSDVLREQLVASAAAVLAVVGGYNTFSNPA